MTGMIRAQARRIGMGLLAMPVTCGIAVAAAGVMVSGVWSRTQIDGGELARPADGDRLGRVRGGRVDRRPAGRGERVHARGLEARAGHAVRIRGRVRSCRRRAYVRAVARTGPVAAGHGVDKPDRAGRRGAGRGGRPGSRPPRGPASTRATVMAVVAVWMFLALLWDPYVLDPVAQRGIPLTVAVIVVGVAWRLLGDEERNVTLARRSI